MKIAGLMPIGRESKPDFGSLNQLVALCDAVIVLADNVEWSSGLPDEIARLARKNEEWNDWTNHLTLLARAAAHGCDWVLLLDDDELLEPSITRDGLHQQIEVAVHKGCDLISYRVREVWSANPLQYRSDGIWGRKRKVVVHRNPLLGGFVHWQGNATARLHAQCLPHGKTMETECQLLHYGMSTPELRQARVDKYKQLDPTNHFNQIGYDYLIDETGMELTVL